MEAGRPLGLRPFGVEAQRVLRLEKQHAIVGHDTDALTTPCEAGPGLGRQGSTSPTSSAATRSGRRTGRGLRQRLVGFDARGTRRPAEEGAAVVADGRPIGRVTSAKWSADLGPRDRPGLAPRRTGGATAPRFDVRVEGGATRRADVVTAAVPRSGRRSA